MKYANDQAKNILSLKEEIAHLKRAVDELAILNDLARAIGASHKSEEIIQTIVRRSLRAVDAEQGVITLVSEREEESMKTLVRTMSSTMEHPQYHLHQNLLGWMQMNKKPLCINSPQHDERFKGVRWDESIHSIVCVPMMIKSELKGILTVCNKKNGKGFTENDQRLLAIIAGQSAQVVENARLYEQEKALVNIQEEIRLASKIQHELLPKENPQLSGYDIAGASIPARVVGGDYFDFIPIDDSCLAICIGDVSGKGLPAAVLMANVQATLRSQTLMNPCADECLGRANTLLHRSTDSDKFVTLFYAILDNEQHTLTYSNAGHDNPFIIHSDKTSERLTTGGIVLGIMNDFSYEEETIELPPGTLFVAYSDGITEAMKSHDEEFGEERLAEILKQNRDKPAKKIIDIVLDEVKRFSSNTQQSDDRTMIVVKRL